MATVQLGQGVWCDDGYVMLDVTSYVSTLASITADGTDFVAKREFHVSLLPVRDIAIGFACDDMIMARRLEYEIVRAIKRYLAGATIAFDGFGDRLYICQKDDRQSIICEAKVKGLSELRTHVHSLIGYSLGQSADHVTLYVSAGNTRGIGVDTATKLAEYCRPLENDVAPSIYRSLVGAVS